MKGSAPGHTGRTFKGFRRFFYLFFEILDISGCFLKSTEPFLRVRYKTYFFHSVRRQIEDCQGFSVVVTRNLRLSEQSLIISTYLSFGTPRKPTDAQICPFLVTPLVCGVFRGRDQGNKNFIIGFGVGVGSGEKIFSGSGAGFGTKNHTPAGL